MDAHYSPLGEKYASVSGGSGLSAIRGRDNPPARALPRTRREGELPARLARDDHADTPLISRCAFNELRRATLDETISDAGSDDEEVIPMDADQLSPVIPAGVNTAGLSVGQIDELTLLLADTPIRKLRYKERLAVKAADGGDPWTALQLRQQVLALAKLCTMTGPYSAQGQFPLLVAEGHYNLASAYADLQCVPQANDHSNKALQALPRIPSGETVEQVTAFKRNVNVLLGEMLLLGTPPKPQAALQYMCKAAGEDNLDSITDPSIKVLVAQCHALLGTAKLHEAYATRRAREALEQRVEALSAKLQQLRPKSSEFGQVQRKIHDNSNELQEEEVFEQALLEESSSQLNKATDILMDVIDGEETRIRQQRDRQPTSSSGEECRDYPPLILLLWRMACEFGFKLSQVEQMNGNVRDQLARLGEIITADNSYQCVPASLMALTYQEKSAALVLRAAQATEADEGAADLQEALDTLDKLLALQDERFARAPAKQDMARAEALKLIGNVNVALAQYGRAQKHFQEALELLAARLGPDSGPVLDLERRIQDVRAYGNA